MYPWAWVEMFSACFWPSAIAGTAVTTGLFISPKTFSKSLKWVLSHLTNSLADGRHDGLGLHIPLHDRNLFAVLHLDLGSVVVEGNPGIIRDVASYGSYTVDLLEVGAPRYLHWDFHASGFELNLEKDGDGLGDRRMRSWASAALGRSSAAKLAPVCLFELPVEEPAFRLARGYLAPLRLRCKQGRPAHPRANLPPSFRVAQRTNLKAIGSAWIFPGIHYTLPSVVE